MLDIEALEEVDKDAAKVDNLAMDMISQENKDIVALEEVDEDAAKMLLQDAIEQDGGKKMSASFEDVLSALKMMLLQEK